MVRSPKAFFFLLLLAGALAVLLPRTGAAADHGVPAAHAAKTYTFHTAYETPIREILAGRIKEAFARLDLKAELLYTPSSQRALMRANQEGDGDAARVTDIKEIAPAHTANLILVPEPIMIMELAVYSKDLAFPVTGWQALQNSHNGARIGAKILEKNIPGKTTFLPTTVQLVRMLDAGRIDTMVEWKHLAEHAIRSVGSTEIRQLTPLLKVQPFHLCLHKKHAALVPKLDKVIREMKEEGLLDDGSKEFAYTGVPSDQTAGLYHGAEVAPAPDQCANLPPHSPATSGFES